jgi:Domain of unknown function (DUF5615)
LLSIDKNESPVPRGRNCVAYIMKGLIRREPLIDFQTADEAALPGKSDEEVLRIAAGAERILVTHDRKTMPQPSLDLFLLSEVLEC